MCPPGAVLLPSLKVPPRRRERLEATDVIDWQDNPKARELESSYFLLR
jgi:hypothetical protein